MTLGGLGLLACLIAIIAFWWVYTHLAAFETGVLSLQERLEGLQGTLASLRAALPTWITWAYLTLTLGLLWIGFLHLSLFGHGWNFWQSRRR